MVDVDPPFTKSIYKVGTELLKRIMGSWREGTVTSYDSTQEIYLIIYNDGDSKEMEHKLLCCHLRRRQYKEAAAKQSRIWLAQTNLQDDQLPNIDSDTFEDPFPNKPWNSCSIITFQNIGQKPDTAVSA